jgi:mono/diheme cytochrome c family protein
MQVKVVIGTISFMLTMIILGFAALREPARLAGFSAAFEGRSIETGARLYQSSCATCHGVNGTATECYDAAGNVIGCKGLPLNSAALLCADRSQRMTALGWEGSKVAFIETTVSAGRIGTAMPTWSLDFGGPMRADQIQNVSAFVLNWESEALCSAPVITFDWPESVEEFVAEFSGGDATNGATLYTSYGCSGCHGDTSIPGSNGVGPWLGEIATVGATRVEGESAAQYVYHSILDPNAFIAPDCPAAPCISPSIMNPNFASSLAANPQDMADILAFLLPDGG